MINAATFWPRYSTNLHSFALGSEVDMGGGELYERGGT